MDIENMTIIGGAGNEDIVRKLADTIEEVTINYVVPEDESNIIFCGHEMKQVKRTPCFSTRKIIENFEFSFIYERMINEEYPSDIGFEKFTKEERESFWGKVKASISVSSNKGKERYMFAKSELKDERFVKLFTKFLNSRKIDTAGKIENADWEEKVQELREQNSQNKMARSRYRHQSLHSRGRASRIVRRGPQL